MAEPRPRSRRPVAQTTPRPNGNSTREDDNAAIIESMSRAQAMIVFDLSGNIITANDNFQRAMGYSLSEIEGRHHSMFVDDATRSSADYRDFWMKLARGEFMIGQFKRVAKGGREIWLQGYYTPILDELNRPVKVIKFATDVTSKVLEQQRAQADQQRLQQMVESATVRLILADRDLRITYMNPASRQALKRLEHLLPCRVEDMIGKSIDLFHRNPEHQRRLLADPKNLPHRAEIKLGDEILDLNVVAIRDSQGNYTGPMVNWDVITDQVKAKQREAKMLEEQRVQQEELERKVMSLMESIQAAASGDLTRDIEIRGDDNMGRLASSMRKMLGDLRNIIGQVIEAATQQNEGARTIAESSANLSEGAQTQAASVEQMTASVEQLIGSIEVISKNASEAKSQAEESTTLAKNGGQTVSEALNSMRLIQKSSEQINDIIQVISEIASQTNLLALNAAIEAARAGEHGLGFAVVADEVRKLAERSSEAAKEITQLIKESSRRVVEGANLSEKVGQSLRSIVDAVDKTGQGISKIAASTETQAASATQVKSAIRSVSQTTESNAAAAEEMAASAEELGAQAQTLRDLVSRFKT